MKPASRREREGERDLERVWRRALPSVRARLALLEQVAADPPHAMPESVDAAISAAAQLERSLGGYGFARAAELAGQTAQLLETEAGGPRLRLLVTELREELGAAATTGL